MRGTLISLRVRSIFKYGEIFDAIEAPASSAKQDSRRLHELDGLRGWAALCVVIFHVFYECLGVRFPVFRNIFTHTFNGRFAVSIFFVLSGEALSTPFFSRKGVQAISSLAVKRHSRLSIPIFASVMLVVILQRFGLVFSMHAADIVRRPDWLGHFAVDPIGINNVVRYALIDVYTSADPDRHIIPFLWTMSAEMVGSIFVFAILGIYNHLRNRFWLLIFLLLILLMFMQVAFLAAFVAGILFASARQQGLFDRARSMRLSQPIAVAVIIILLLSIASRPLGSPRSYTATAIVLAGAVFVSHGASAFFRTRFSRFLGKISFPLYLVHFSVIVSFTSGLIVRESALGLLDVWTAFWIGLASIVLALVVAFAFEPIELLTKHAGRILSRTFVDQGSRRPYQRNSDAPDKDGNASNQPPEVERPLRGGPA